MVEGKEVYLKSYKAASMIQTKFRQSVIMKSEGLWISACRGSVKAIQKIARGFLARLYVAKRRAIIEAAWRWINPTFDRKTFNPALPKNRYEVSGDAAKARRQAELDEALGDQQGNDEFFHSFAEERKGLGHGWSNAEDRQFFMVYDEVGGSRGSTLGWREEGGGRREEPV